MLAQETTTADRLLQVFQQTSGVQGGPTLESTGLALLMAFALGQLFAWLYSRTHTGISYSKTFTQSLVLIMMVVAPCQVFALAGLRFTAAISRRLGTVAPPRHRRYHSDRFADSVLPSVHLNQRHRRHRRYHKCPYCH